MEEVKVKGRLWVVWLMVLADGRQAARAVAKKARQPLEAALVLAAWGW